MGIVSWWRDRRDGVTSPVDKGRVDAAVERVVQTTNPKLRFARNYRARLAPSVATSLAYVGDLVAAIPGAREASSLAWSADPYMHAYFGTADNLVQAFSRSTDLRAFFDQNPLDGNAYAVLGMEMVERKTIGMALDGEAVRGDVAQTAVSFDDHGVRIVGRNELDLRAEIQRRLIDQLALEGLAHVIADQSRRTDLEQERALLKSRLQLQERNGAGMRGAFGGDAIAPAETASLQVQLESNEKELDSLGGAAEILDRELESIACVLAVPEQHLTLSSRRLRLDRLNIVIEDQTIEAGNEFDFLVARLPGTTPPRTRAITLICFPRSEMLPVRRFNDDAARMLG